MTLFVGCCSSQWMPRFAEMLLYLFFDLSKDFQINLASNRNECYIGTVVIYDWSGGGEYSIMLPQKEIPHYFLTLYGDNL